VRTDVLALRQAYIKQCQPILKGLQCKAAQYESDAESSEPSLGKIIGIVLDERIHRRAEAGDNASYQSYAKGKRPGMVNVMNEGAADKRSRNVAYGADNRAPELAPREPWAARGCIVSTGAHTARIGNYLAKSDENGKGDCKPKTQRAVKPYAETQPADCGKHSLPKQGVVVKAARGSIEFNGKRNARSNAGGEPKEKSEADAVPDAEGDRVRHRPGKQSQRPMLAAQQVIRQIQASDHVKTGAGDADGCDGVVVHRIDCRGNALMRRCPTLFVIAILCLSGCTRKGASVETSSELDHAIATLRAAYAAFNRGDIEAAVQALDAQIEWTEPPEFPGGGTYHGREGAKQYLAQSRAAWAEVISEPVQFIPAGDRIVVFVHARVRPKNSREWQEVNLADVYTFRGGKAVAMRAFADRQEALRWVGAERPDQ
jgi:ketosteroid isomerase-like protein